MRFSLNLWHNFRENRTTTTGGYFLVVRFDGDVLLQFAEPGVDFPPQHYAFLVSEDDFDGIHGRLRDSGVEYWAAPQQRLPQQYNTNHGGRGVYFCDPPGHYLEAIARPYGSDTTA